MVAAHPASHCENPLMFGFQINEIELTYQERPAWLLQIRNERTNKQIEAINSETSNRA
jgi:hypothetical protein